MDSDGLNRDKLYDIARQAPLCLVCGRVMHTAKGGVRLIHEDQDFAVADAGGQRPGRRGSGAQDPSGNR